MSKVMETTSLPSLLARVAGEYRAKASIFEIPEEAFRRLFELESESPGMEVMGKRISLPVGPAAGPHSQIAPNLVAAYLAGARAFELKTVQENDALEIAKPCIEALDEGHNTEWSTELSLEDARGEYLRGWIAIRLLGALFSPSPDSLLFNMSVGYTLEGIRGAKVDSFIEGMRNPPAAFWEDALGALDAFVESPAFGEAFCRGPGAGAMRERARALLADFPSSPVHSATLSTMHGCPPDEIERIGSYLIEEKGLDVFVKLNPTLLGFDEARRILDATRWRDIEIRRDNFERDLRFSDALRLVSSLGAKARAKGRRFGIKLSNTLANANTGGFLPGGERYMSGRALYPLTVALAANLAAALPGWDSRFSYCGGVWAKNAGALVAAGLGPLTAATDILKPGGYLRLGPVARAAVAALPLSPDRPDAAALARLAEEALGAREYRAGWKSGEASIPRKLPLFDCFAAPCVEACPVHQKAPEYIALGASGDFRGALGLILADNPLPFVTGALCDHVCQDACCRNDYEGPVEIRAVKLACARGAATATGSPSAPPRGAGLPRARVAIIGAGPAGLSCAHMLAVSGVPATVFDKAGEPGGVPANVIPRFRLDRRELAADIGRIEAEGVEFRLGVEVSSLEALEAEGFTDFFVASGAPVPRELEIEGDAIPVVDALRFLEEGSRAMAEGRVPPFGRPRRVMVAGGGNTAMDAVRLALRMPGIEEVRLSYRRSVDEMPADREELENALAEGAKLMELTLPERCRAGSEGPALELRVMEPGDRDASGRRSPRATGQTLSVGCDLLVAAVGESPDAAFLQSLGIAVDAKGKPIVDPETLESGRDRVYVGGDASRGPASIISAAADGRRAALSILRARGVVAPARPSARPSPGASSPASRGEIVDSLDAGASGFAAREAERCLRCDAACLRCVEVCPNRANVALPVDRDSGFAQSIQILHVDALCNECGNCGLFCPYEGEPFRGKASLFRSREALSASGNSGFAIMDDGPAPRLSLRASPGGPVATLAFPDWSAARGSVSPTDAEAEDEADAEAEASMASIARTVYRDHPYLLEGGTR